MAQDESCSDTEDWLQTGKLTAAFSSLSCLTLKENSNA